MITFSKFDVKFFDINIEVSSFLAKKDKKSKIKLEINKFLAKSETLEFQISFSHEITFPKFYKISQKGILYIGCYNQADLENFTHLWRTKELSTTEMFADYFGFDYEVDKLKGQLRRMIRQIRIEQSELAAASENL